MIDKRSMHQNNWEQQYQESLRKLHEKYKHVVVRVGKMPKRKGGAE